MKNLTVSTGTDNSLAGSRRRSHEPRRRPLIADILDNGGPGYVQFAITNICNARCEFCGFAANRMASGQRRSVSLEEAQDAIDICAANGIGYILFVGGEPLVHRELLAMVKYAAERGLRPMICTNGSLWTDENVREHAAAGLSSVIMSVDAPDVEVHEKHRGLPGVCQKIQRANQLFRDLGVETIASITMSRLVGDYGRLPSFLRGLGFDRCTFSYPLTTLGSSYLSCSKSELVAYSKDELLRAFEEVKKLKRGGEIAILNPFESLCEMQRHLKGEKERFGCLGGYKYFYLDWELQLYRCHYWEKPMCHIRDFDTTKLIRDGCTRCMIDCYRDPSVLQFIAVNTSDAWNSLRRGRLLSAIQRLCDPRNLVSLRAVWENRKWINGI
ncbi:MAG: radical SAM protein [Verrucomicrobiae bacterium]|nr:radical SAM protein [Verrucomicrobiae bacterium]